MHMYYTIGVPLPKIMKIAIPKKLITAVALNTALQLPVTSRIYPARYTPRNPIMKKKQLLSIFIMIVRI